MNWEDLCEEVDTLVYVTEYLPAGGTRTFEQWRRGEWPPEHSRRHPLKSYDPAWHVRPLARFDGVEGA